MPRPNRAQFFEFSRPWIVWSSVICVWAWIMTVTLVPRASQSYFLLALAIISFAGPFVFIFQRHRAKRLLLKHDFRVCNTCRYILTGLPDEGACPECGQKYERAELRGLWQDRYSLY